MDPNIEAAVRRALTAYKAETGASAATSAAWAAQNLAAGVAVFTATLADGANANNYTPAEQAFEDLKAWATPLL